MAASSLARRRLRGIGLGQIAGLACLLVLAGCYRPPQVAPGNLEVITSLRTAISTRSLQRLADNERVLNERHAKGELSDSELGAFRDLIALARGGDWEKAEQRVVQFQRAQRPTQEQIDRLPKPKKPG